MSATLVLSPESTIDTASELCSPWLGWLAAEAPASPPSRSTNVSLQGQVQ